MHTSATTLRRFASTVALIAVPGLLTTTAAVGQPGLVGDGPATTVHVTSSPVADAIPAGIIGANGRWLKNELGGWNPDANSPDPKLGSLARQIHLNAVRYPGGTVANLFQWKNAIGPRAQRSCQVGGGFVGRAEPYDSTFGPDEQQQFVADIGGSTLMMTPATESSAGNAADFVEYMNSSMGTNPAGGTAWADVRATNGHAAPYGVTWWEIGNEPSHAKERYWRSADKATALHQYVFGGTQRQVDQSVGQPCDHRPSAGESSGAPNQDFTVWYPPVVPGSQAVRVDGSTWQPVKSLETAGPDDHVYSIDPESGTIRFGDGVHGAVPEKGAVIDADYDSGPHPGFVDYYRAMKSVDPDIMVCSAWADAAFVELMGRDHPYDCLAPHLYASPDTSGTTQQIHGRLIPHVETNKERLAALRQAELTYGPSGSPAPIEVGEYGTIVKAGRTAPTGWTGSLSWTLYAAGVLDGMIENNVRIASISNLNNAIPTTGALFGGAPDFFMTARAKMLGLYSGLVGSRPVESSVSGNPDAGGYRALQVLAVQRDERGTALVVINRDPSHSVPAGLALPGAGLRGRVRAATLDGADVASYNTDTDETAVSVTVSHPVLHGPVPTYTFPAHSVTLLTAEAR